MTAISVYLILGPITKIAIILEGVLFNFVEPEMEFEKRHDQAEAILFRQAFLCLGTLVKQHWVLVNGVLCVASHRHSTMLRSTGDRLLWLQRVTAVRWRRVSEVVRDHCSVRV